MKLNHKMLAAVAAVAIGTSVSADDSALRAKGKATLKDAGDAVITLQMVHSVSMAFGGRDMGERENKSEAIATIIQADGLAVAPLSEVDPASMYRTMMRRQMTAEDKFETKIKDLKYILADNTEIPAMVVLRDSDLDLAFLRPKEKPASAMKHVTLDKDTKAEVLDSIYTIGRLGKLGKRGPMAMTGEINGTIEKPRPFYFPGGDVGAAGTGVPVFNADGKAIGLLLTKAMEMSDDDNERGGGPELIVLPSSEVLEMASQAPEKAEEPPAEEATAETTEGSEAPSGS